MNDKPPSQPIGSGIGEYARRNLTPEQEDLFHKEVKGWIEKGWMVEHDASIHGEAAAVLPLIAQVQEHKVTTPVRPCLDYRNLNDCIVSYPGLDAPDVGDKLRKWRRLAGEAEQYVLLDICKAYLQVYVAPELLKYQTVVYGGKLYVMTRMGFGLSIAPKFLNVIIQWVTRNLKVDNYIDDLMVPTDRVGVVAAELEKFGLPTKPEESLMTARVLGLQLDSSGGSMVWRRQDKPPSLPSPLTKRSLFSWCGKIIGQLPVCSWLRVSCSYLKRMASEFDWDVLLPSQVVQCCEELESRLCAADPAHGIWQVADASDTEFKVWCDASDLALGVVLEADGHDIEDGTWLRERSDKRHINVAELQAVVKGLTMASYWNAKRVHLLTDSKTVAGWLNKVVNNIGRVKISGLNEVLVLRRLQIIADMIVTVGLTVSVEWVPSNKNRADRLTRVPSSWSRCAKAVAGEQIVAAAVCSSSVVGPVTLDDIVSAQSADTTVQTVMQQLENDLRIHDDFKCVHSQLFVDSSVLYRCAKLPIDGVIHVPVVPKSLVGSLLEAAHINSGHASWETMYDQLRSRCYFPLMSDLCQEFVKQCSACLLANPRKGARVPPSRAEIPGRPWSQVAIDTLELGSDQSGKYHCVLVAVDMFTRWVEVEPLRRHDALCVADAFTRICCRWGPPDVVKVDNGSEFSNAIVSALFHAFGVHVKTGAVRHPQSQGAAERFNRTLLNLIHKLLVSSGGDWKANLDVLLFYYRNRPHQSTKISPMEAMVGWRPHRFILEEATTEFQLSEWTEKLAKRSARIRDWIDSEMSASDFIERDVDCPFSPGDQVLLERPARHQKRLPPFESGWVVVKVISPSNVVIASPGRQEKVVNVSLLKFDVQVSSSEEDGLPDASVTQPRCQDDSVAAEVDIVVDIARTTAGDAEPNGDEPSVSAYSLRDRGQLRAPARYRSEE